MAKILIADVIEGQEIQSRILQTNNELVFASTIVEAEELLVDQSFDLISVGVLFDESQMFNLLDIIKKLHSTTPIVCVRSVVTPIISRSSKKLHIACTALGACSFVDITKDAIHGNELQAAVKKCLDGKDK